MTIFPQSGAKGLERFPTLKNNNVQKRGSRFSLGIDALKNMHRIKKSFNFFLRGRSELGPQDSNPLAHCPIPLI